MAKCTECYYGKGIVPGVKLTADQCAAYYCIYCEYKEKVVKNTGCSHWRKDIPWNGNDCRGTEDILVALSNDGSTWKSDLVQSWRNSKGIMDFLCMVLEAWSVRRTVNNIKKRRENA